MSICPKFNKCPIYQKTAAVNNSTLENFKTLYCTADGEKYKTCIRYIVSEKVGKKVPAYILPNTKLTVDEVIKIMEK